MLLRGFVLLKRYGNPCDFFFFKKKEKTIRFLGHQQNVNSHMWSSSDNFWSTMIRSSSRFLRSEIGQTSRWSWSAPGSGVINVWSIARVNTFASSTSPTALRMQALACWIGMAPSSARIKKDAFMAIEMVGSGRKWSEVVSTLMCPPHLASANIASYETVAMHGRFSQCPNSIILSIDFSSMGSVHINVCSAMRSKATACELNQKTRRCLNAQAEFHMKFDLLCYLITDDRPLPSKRSNTAPNR